VFLGRMSSRAHFALQQAERRSAAVSLTLTVEFNSSASYEETQERPGKCHANANFAPKSSKLAFLLPNPEMLKVPSPDHSILHSRLLV
jgi:hypothetical protein